jgi:hypothetical protein
MIHTERTKLLATALNNLGVGPHPGWRHRSVDQWNRG